MSEFRFAAPLGTEIPASEWFPRRSVIGELERTARGNVAVRVGREAGVSVGGWEQTEYVVITRAEALELIEALTRAVAQ